MFDNTEIAFRHKSGKELIRAKALFRILSCSFLVGAGRLLLRTGLPLAWILKPTVYKHFCGGKDLEACIPVMNKMYPAGVRSIPDYSAEQGSGPKGMEQSLEESLKAILFSSGRQETPFAVFKPSAFCPGNILEKASGPDPLLPEEEIEAAAFKARVQSLCQSAFEKGLPILIDAEYSFHQAFVDEVVREMMRRYNRKKAIVFNTFQMYRTDRMSFLKKSYQDALKYGYVLGAKFVRGAYMERERTRARHLGLPSPIHPDKEHTDRDFNHALAFATNHIEYISVFCGTHNEYSSAFLSRLMKEKGISPGDPHIWFSQLYGMSDHISFNLARLGYNVAKYLPYGPVKKVLPYLLRRAEENRSVSGQTPRELELITNELHRRKKQDKTHDHQQQ